MDIKNVDTDLFTKLRDCFYGGYFLPQFCVDSNVSSPIIVSLYPEFLWEAYVQFRYDKRVNADFCLIQSKDISICFSPNCVLGAIPLKEFNLEELRSHDMVIMLTVARIEESDVKTIYMDQLLNMFISHVYAEMPLHYYIKKHKGVKLIVTHHPLMKNNQFTTDYERFILSNGDIHSLREKLKSNKSSVIPNQYDIFGYSNEEIINLLELAGARTNPDGSTILVDDNNPLVNIKNGRRMTAYQPKDYDNTIYLMGTCTYFGIGAPFDKTIESYLQKHLNEGNFKYKVENVSQFFAGRYQDIFYNLNSLPTHEGDIIFMFIQYLRPANIPFLDISNVFDRPHNYGEVFADSNHLNENGYKVLADIFYDILIKYKFFENYDVNFPDFEPSHHLYGIPEPMKLVDSYSKRTNYNFDISLQKNLDTYKSMLRKVRLNIGCIVMNCNPFTLGHRYLVECAISQVTLLYIFVVEEDQSEFSFADRLHLVEQGLSDIPNVKILPSGKFIISQLTFSGYFNKAKLQNTNVDSKFDIKLFAEEIAPELGINVRFAGEEPNDTVTKQYNDNMRKILPKHGINFVEIPRKTIDGEVISAKRVRTLLQDHNFNDLSKLVPETTLNYLKKKFPICPPPAGVCLIQNSSSNQHIFKRKRGKRSVFTAA